MLRRSVETTGQSRRWLNGWIGGIATLRCGREGFLSTYPNRSFTQGSVHAVNQWPLSGQTGPSYAEAQLVLPAQTGRSASYQMLQRIFPFADIQVGGLKLKDARQMIAAAAQSPSISSLAIHGRFTCE